MAELTNSEILLKAPRVKTITSGIRRWATVVNQGFTAKKTSLGRETAYEVAGTLVLPFKVYSLNIVFKDCELFDSATIITKKDDYSFSYNYYIKNKVSNPVGDINIEYEDWLIYLSEFNGVLLASEWEFYSTDQETSTKCQSNTPQWIDQQTTSLSFSLNDWTYSWVKNDTNGLMQFNWALWFSKFWSWSDNILTTYSQKLKLTKLRFVAIGD